MASLTPPLRCLAFAHRILSDFAVPGAISDSSSSSPDIIIRRTASRADGGVAGRSLWREGATLHFEPRGVAAYRCTPPDTIEVAPFRSSDDGDIAAFLISTALPGLLWLRGAFMLHASAAVMPGQERAVAVAAPSGAGKSAILAEMVARGARVVADDSVCLRPVDGYIASGGLPGGYFRHHPDPAARPFTTVDPWLAIKEAPLGAILLLSRHMNDEPATFCRLAPFDTLSAILSHRHRPAIPTLFGDPARRLSDAVRIAGTATFRWSRPDGPIRLTDSEWQTIVRIGGTVDDV